MPPFRDDQILIIAPGSQTTLAQLGLPESFTPARYRIPSRMFPAQESGQYEPFKVRKKEKKEKPAPVTAPVPAPTSAEGEEASASADTNGDGAKPAVTEEEDEWEEDRYAEDGAVWPIQKGSIVDWPAFYGLMEHVYQTISPPFHTPILIIAEPVWTHREYEKVAQYFFEKFKTPALAMMDAAVAASYAYGVANATVVDVGYEKADVSCVADFVLQDLGRGLAIPGCGGEDMTRRLMTLLKDKPDFTHEVCEQLKKSAICEILPSDLDLPTADASEAINPAAAASTGADGAAPKNSSAVGDLPRGPGPGTEVGEEKKTEDDGVLDIASIVTSNNLTEVIAQKEKEKAASKQKKGDAAAAANKPARLPNAKRVRNTFTFEDHVQREVAIKAAQAAADAQAAAAAAAAAAEAAASATTTEGAAANGESAAPQPAEPAPSTAGSTTESISPASYRREIEVGLERFQAASDGLLDRLADSIFRTVQSCGEVQRRGDLWNSLIIVGNGARVRGFKEALLATLQAKYIISPSSATIFTSELPSNLSTPAATGTNTPQAGIIPPPSNLGGGMPGGGVNPLLHAALTASQFPPPPATGYPPGMAPPVPQHPLAHLHSSSSHGQTPMNIRLAKIPEYFPEWKETGYDEATFLGAQVAGKVLFIADGGASKAYLTRSDYNEQGPGGIHDVRL